MNWFVDSLVRERHRTDLVDGLKAFVRLYYSEYSDATELEVDARHAMALLIDRLLGFGPSADAEEMLYGGVGPYWKVRTAAAVVAEFYTLAEARAWLGARAEA